MELYFRVICQYVTYVGCILAFSLNKVALPLNADMKLGIYCLLILLLFCLEE